MKKFLAGVLAFAMAASMMTATVFAEPDDGESQGSSTTIQTDRKGSITIHKYVSEEFAEGEGWPNGNTPSSGEELTAPTGAHPLDGVTFTVYKIADADDVLDYYSGVQERIDRANIPTQDQLFYPDDSGNVGSGYYICRKDWYTNKWILDDQELNWGQSAELIGSLTTGGKDSSNNQFNPGEVVFGDLDVGIYLVIETDSPDTVVAPADPFLVSIPLTVNHINAEGKVANSEWIYNVHAYPKNTTIVSGDVQIVKNGKITGTTAQPLAGVKFQLQKQETVPNPSGWGSPSTTWVPVTQTKDKFGNTINLGETFGEYEGVITSQQGGLVTVSSLSPGNYRFVEIQTLDGYILLDKGGWYFEINSDGELEWSKTPYSGSVQNFVYGATWYEEPKIPEGQQPENSAYHDVGGIPNAINERPDIDKRVAPKTAPDDYTKKEANYSVDDEIPYQLTIKVPGSVYNLETLTISDNPTNMKDNQESIKIWVNDTEITETLATYGKFEEPENENGFKFSFIPSSLMDYTGEKSEWGYIENYGKNDVTIKIEYTATLLGGASVTAIKGNPNEATLEYSSNYSGGGTNKITDRTVVYSGEINVHKKDGANNAPLDGVLFELYEQLDKKIYPDINPGDTVGEGENAKQTLSSADASAKGLKNPLSTAYVQIGDIYETKNGGNISVEGLSDGRYWLVETKTVGNYNLLQGPVEILLELGHETWMNSEVECTWQDSTKTITEYDEKWQLVERDVTVREFVVNKNVIDLGKSTFTQTVNNEGKNLGRNIDVINRQGFNLPATGGMGTFIFTFVGIAMMAAAVILFITSKKKEAA